MTLVLERAIELAQKELAEGSHTPTPAMVSTAKRGLRKAKGREIEPGALAMGRRIASGQKLNDSHVEHMAAYNAALDSPPVGDSDQDVEHMLWAGAPGAAWSNARVCAMDVSQLADDDAPTILALDEEGRGVSLEVFVRDGMGERIELENDLLWAPILRSGMLAMRPGPNGEKVEKPLVFVPGRASDSRKEIGLQNLVDNFKAGAVQHVTIPTSHENKVTENTGFIKDLKIVPSKQRPGEVVLMGAHDIRDPQVHEKIKLGTIANRSCGIVYDYVNTETGERYDQVLDHVALTNRPWVRGMTAYGDSADLSDREVIPMLLSERPGVDLADVSEDGWDGSASRFTDQQWRRSCVLDHGTGTAKERYGLPIREPDGTLNRNAVHNAAARFSQVKNASLAQKKAAARSLIAAYGQLNEDPPDSLRHVVSASTSLSDAEREALLLADVQWGSTLLSMNRITDQVVAQLQNFTDPDEVYPIYSVMDVLGAPDPKALVRVRYGGSDPDDAWVVPLEVDGDKVSLSDYSQWTPVQKEWVTDEDAAEDKAEVAQILGGQTGLSIAQVAEEIHLAVLTQAERDKLPDSDFALPGRQYPIHDLDHARDALSRIAQHGTPSQQREVRAKVFKRYPQLKASSKTNMSNPTPTLTGGAMPPTTQEVIERLGLSEEQRAALTPLINENAQLKTQLGEVKRASREETVKSRVKALQESGFPAGFCRLYEETALADDGLAAASLNLSDDDGQQTGEQTYTVTEVVDRFIAALPTGQDGKLALANVANLVTSPISARPPLTVADQQEQEARDSGKRVQTGEQWLSEMEKVAPGISQAFNLEEKKGA